MAYFPENSMGARLRHAQDASRGGKKAGDFMLCICCPLEIFAAWCHVIQSMVAPKKSDKTIIL